MLSLYEILQIDSNSTPEQIEKGYFAMYRRYKYDNESLIRINLAYKILMDTHKRSFYLRFGDNFLKTITDTKNSMLITRFFTSSNCFLMLLSFYLIAVNFFCYGALSLMQGSNQLANIILFLVSPIVLCGVSLNTSLILPKNDPIFTKFNTALLVFLLNNFSIAIAFTNSTPYFYIILESMLIYLVYCKFKEIGVDQWKLLLVFLLKSVFIGLVGFANIENSIFLYILPMIFALSFSIFHRLAGIALFSYVLPNAVGLYLIHLTSYYKTGMTIISVYSLISLILISISLKEVVCFGFKKLHFRLKLPPVTEFDV